MALDGAFLRHLKQEIESRVLDAKIDKIYQPSREEIVLMFRTRTEHHKLLLSARANSARIHFTKASLENPKQPPMFCMLMRKRLAGARLVQIRQPALERALLLDFDAINELGDSVRLTLVIEIMGRYSNVIFVDNAGMVVDALKRVDAEKSSERLVLPGIAYRQPPQQDKLSILSVSPEDILQAMDRLPQNMELSKGLLSVLQGVSPIVCRELEYRAGHGVGLYTRELSDEQRGRLRFFLEQFRQTVQQVSGRPYLVDDRIRKKPVDFSFLPVEQYGTSAVVRCYSTFSELLDSFYEERDRIDRMRVKEHDLLKILTNTADRLSRKINLQKAELEQCAGRDALRVYGDLISANMYQIPKGAKSVELQNFYEETQPLIKIRMDPALTPSQNAQKYYKEYRKAHTAEEKLTEQIAQAQQDLVYIESVFDELSRAQTERDLSEIRQELREQGYLKPLHGKQKPVSPSAPMEFHTSDGFRVLVGRNNHQNDRLTMKQANNNDIWFHTKNIPGSHTVVITENRPISETAILEAARIAAYYSKGKDSSQVPVDYTQIRHVSKPSGAKPGMVIYVNYKTVFVTPTLPVSEKPNEEMQ